MRWEVAFSEYRAKRKKLRQSHGPVSKQMTEKEENKPREADMSKGSETKKRVPCVRETRSWDQGTSGFWLCRMRQFPRRGFGFGGMGKRHVGDPHALDWAK